MSKHLERISPSLLLIHLSKEVLPSRGVEGVIRKSGCIWMTIE